MQSELGVQGVVFDETFFDLKRNIYLYKKSHILHWGCCQLSEDFTEIDC